MKSRIAIVGPGRVGQSVGKMLCVAGYPVRAVVGRDIASTRTGASFIGAELTATIHLERCCAADAVLITVPDDALCSVIEALTHIDLHPGKLLIHCSGLHTTRIFAPLEPEARDIHTLSLHPLQTFASPEAGYAALPGSFCSLQGDKFAIERGYAMAEDLGCRAFEIDAEHKIHYHAAACMVSNYVTTLIDAAAELCADISGADDIFPAAFEPLLEAAVRNSIEVGTRQALTGPIVRGDIGTLAAHVRKIQSSNPDLFPLYRVLARQTLEVALKAGRLEQHSAAQMRNILDRT